MPHGDPRVGTDDSGHVTIASGDGNTPQTAYDIPADALFRVDRVKIEYDDGGTVDGVDVQLWDDADGTAAGAVSDQRDEFPNLDSDMKLEAEGPWRVFEEDVLVSTANGSQDADVDVTVYGELLTDLADMTGYGY